METEDYDQEDPYPPPREEEPDLGPPYTSDELYREAGTVTGTLQEDMIETANRTYNKKIANIQKEHYLMMEALLNDTVKEANRYAEEHPEIAPQLIADNANLRLTAERQRLKKFLRQAIDMEQDELQKQITRIRQYIESLTLQ